MTVQNWTFWIVLWGNNDGTTGQNEFDNSAARATEFVEHLKHDETIVWVSAYERKIRWVRPASDPADDQR